MQGVGKEARHLNYMHFKYPCHSFHNYPFNPFIRWMRFYNYEINPEDSLGLPCKYPAGLSTEEDYIPNLLPVTWSLKFMNFKIVSTSNFTFWIFSTFYKGNNFSFSLIESTNPKIYDQILSFVDITLLTSKKLWKGFSKILCSCENCISNLVAVSSRFIYVKIQLYEGTRV